MTVNFEIVPYKAMAGYYIRAEWPDGRMTNIEDSSSPGPAFKTEAEAQLWIDNESAEWLRRLGVTSKLLPAG